MQNYNINNVYANINSFFGFMKVRYAGHVVIHKVG